MTNAAPTLDPGPAFLELVIDDPDAHPALRCYCAGFESGLWRCEQFAEYLMDWVLDFAEPGYQQIPSFTARRRLKEAALAMYQTEKYSSRGEFGELILHTILRQHYHSDVLISKIFFKDAPNDTVKGFDCVHIITREDRELELWLGEAKFYGRLDAAVRAILTELQSHTRANYLRQEFVAISNKLERSPYAQVFEQLYGPRANLDQIFTRLRIPILLTYDSKAVQRHYRHCDQYIAELTQEARFAHRLLTRGPLPAGVTLHLILVPLRAKAHLVEELNRKLVGQQQ